MWHVQLAAADLKIIKKFFPSVKKYYYDYSPSTSVV